MIETLIALLVLSVMGGAVVYILAQTTALNNQAKLRNQAQLLAEAAIEEVRNYYQVNYWLALKSKATTTTPPICYSDGTLGSITSCTVDSNTSNVAVANYPDGTFKRRVKLQIVGNGVAAIAEIIWKDKSSTYNAKASDSTVFYAY